MAKETLSDKFDALSAREKKMLAAMAIIMPILVMVVISGLFSRSLGSIEDQTREYQKSLDLLAVAGPVYLKKQAPTDKNTLASLFTEEVLTDNPVKLTGFMAARATEAGVSPNSYDTEEIPLGGSSSDKSQPMLFENKVRVDIRATQINDLMKFLEVIERSGEPVVIKRIDLRGNSRVPGEVRARVEVSTFVKKKKEG
ncbi:hypothetical protein [Bradymonas sediminis]|uniref:Uncharacterized protein n=1 Tax=Bradymonas sediminis TaxID=1548548 RepID=A0A2Z4FGB9_9DELT|nr:hypothetical protein [Bradymonas sediminis]AWV87888.1 hypothetical protein DN745_00515 [Bradymonas sediminis]TDP62903.1 hypothetical protein DFR33_11136 [Bradymonas sediminis]